jgi:hypothetical protein
MRGKNSVFPPLNCRRIIGLGAQTHGLVDVETFDSIYHPGKVIVMAFWRDAKSAEAWTPRRPDAARMRHRRVRIIRTYGMSDRREGMRRPTVLTALPLRPAWPRAGSWRVTPRMDEMLPVGITRYIHLYDK